MSNKKRYLIVAVICCVFAVGFIYNNTKKEEQVEITKFTYFDYFDTIITVSVYEEVDPAMEETIGNELARIHNLTSNFDSYEGVENINDLNQNLSIKSDEELVKLIEYSKKNYNEISNQFNIALGPVIDIWKDYLIECNEGNVCDVPSSSELSLASTNIDPNNIVITDDSITIEEGMKIDLGGIAKGYAADSVASMLKDQGINHFLINAGGNIIVSDKPNKDGFKVAIIDPVNNNENFIILNIKNSAVVTSGDYERFYVVDGVRYSHLINNDTLYPSTTFRSVSVISSSSMESDAWTTMLFGMELEDGMDLVEATEGIEAIWYVSEDEIYKSSGVKQYEEE